MTKTHSKGIRYSAALGIALLLYIPLDYAVLLGYSLTSLHIDLHSYLITTVTTLLPLLLSVCIVFRRDIFPRPVLRELLRFTPKDVFVWTLAIFAIIRLAVLIGNTAYGLIIGGEIPVPPHTQASFDSVPNFLYSILLAPLIEELAFRQFLYKPLKKVNTTLAVLVPAVLFAVSHGNLFQCVYALPAGILMGVARARYGSLVFSLLVHSLNNISTILISECLRSEGLLSKIFDVIEVVIVVAGVVCLLGIIVKALQRRKQKQIDEPQPSKKEPGRIFAFDLSVALWICAAFLIITCGIAISAGYGTETYPKFQIAMAAICAVNLVFTIRNALHKRRQSAVLNTVQPSGRTAKFKISPVLWLGIAAVIAYTAYIHFD